MAFVIVLWLFLGGGTSTDRWWAAGKMWQENNSTGGGVFLQDQRCLATTDRKESVGTHHGVESSIVVAVTSKGIVVLVTSTLWNTSALVTTIHLRRHWSNWWIRYRWILFSNRVTAQNDRFYNISSYLSSMEMTIATLLPFICTRIKLPLYCSLSRSLSRKKKRWSYSKNDVLCLVTCFPMLILYVK